MASRPALGLDILLHAGAGRGGTVPNPEPTCIDSQNTRACCTSPPAACARGWGPTIDSRAAVTSALPVIPALCRVRWSC